MAVAATTTSNTPFTARITGWGNSSTRFFGGKMEEKIISKIEEQIDIILAKERIDFTDYQILIAYLERAEEKEKIKRSEEIINAFYSIFK